MYTWDIDNGNDSDKINAETSWDRAVPSSYPAEIG